MPLDFSIENTTAASVDITIEPGRSLSGRIKSLNGDINIPIIIAVSTTSAVESAIPCENTGFISLLLVSSPPENRINARAMDPMNFAARGSLKLMLADWLSPPS